MQWWAGNRSGAELAGREAVDVLGRAADTRLLALALSNQSQLCMLAHRLAESITYGERAVALAGQVNDAAIISHALANIGSSQSRLGDPAGQRGGPLAYLWDQAEIVLARPGDQVGPPREEKWRSTRTG